MSGAVKKKPPPRLADDRFPAVRTGEMDDLALLPRRFDQFAEHVRTSFDLLGEKILGGMSRIDEALRDMSHRIGRLERGQRDLDRRVAELEKANTKRMRRK